MSTITDLMGLGVPGPWATRISAISPEVTDGTTTVTDVSALSFPGSTVTGTALGTATVTAPGAFNVATVRIPSASLVTLNTVPVPIVAAPGANKAIIPISAVAVELFLTAAYTNITAPDLYTSAGTSGPHWGMSTAWTTLFGLGASAVVQAAVVMSAHSTTAALANVGLYLADSTAWATGAGSAVISVAYIVVPTV